MHLVNNWSQKFPFFEKDTGVIYLHCCNLNTILGDPGAVSRNDTMFVVKVCCKIVTRPWALILTEPVPEAFELPASDFFLANQ